MEAALTASQPEVQAPPGENQHRPRPATAKLSFSFALSCTRRKGNPGSSVEAQSRSPRPWLAASDIGVTPAGFWLLGVAPSSHPFRGFPFSLARNMKFLQEGCLLVPCPHLVPTIIIVPLMKDGGRKEGRKENANFICHKLRKVIGFCVHRL